MALTSTSLPNRVGRYELGPRIDIGGGERELYRAWDPLLGRSVSLERLRCSEGIETLCGARLEHPHVVRIFDCISAERGDWLVRAPVDGVLLRRAVTDGGLEPSRAVALLHQIASAGAAAHAAGAARCSVDSGSILVSERGIEILGFEPPLTGAATEPSDWSLTPEGLRGEPTDARSDLFSLGHLAVELLTGRSPFAGDTEEEIASKVLHLEVPSLASTRLELPAALCAMVARMLDKSPERRPGSFRELLEVLEREAPGAPAREEELRSVTIVSIRFEPLAYRPLDPLALAELQATVLDAASSVEASVLSSAGNQALVMVGYPRAHESNAERAFEFVERLRHRLREAAAGVSLGATLDVGLVALLRRLGRVIAAGPPLDRVEELWSQASKGKVLVATGLRPQLQATGRRVRSLPRREGFVAAAEWLVGPNGDIPPLVGREPVLARLRALWKDARKLDRVILLDGPAGVGKTSVAKALVRELQQEGAVVIHCDLARDSKTRSYGLVERLLAELPPDADASAEHRALTDFARGVATEDQRARLRRTGEELTPTRIARALASAVLERIPTDCALVLDDVEGADAASRVLLFELIRQASSNGLFTLLVAREGASPELIKQVELRIELAPLSDADARALARSCAPVEHSAAALDAIVRRSAGVPLWIRELATLDPERGIPPTAADFASARLQAVSCDGRHLAELLAIHGGPCSMSLVHRCHPHRSFEEFSRVVEGLEGASLIRRSTQAGEDTLELRHVLVADAILEACLPRAAGLARQLYEALRPGFPDADPDRRAALAERAELWEASAKHWHDAARLAQRLDDHQLAVGCCERGLSALARSSDRSAHLEIAMRETLADVVAAAHGRGTDLAVSNAATLLRLRDGCSIPSEWQDSLHNWFAAYALADIPGMEAWAGIMEAQAAELSETRTHERAALRYLTLCSRGLVGYHSGALETSYEAFELALRHREAALPVLSTFPDRAMSILPGIYIPGCWAMKGATERARSLWLEEERRWPRGSPEHLTACSFSVVGSYCIDDHEEVARKSHLVTEHASEGRLSQTHVLHAKLVDALLRLEGLLSPSSFEGHAASRLCSALDELDGARREIKSHGLVIGQLLLQTFALSLFARVAQLPGLDPALAERARDLGLECERAALDDLGRPGARTSNIYVLPLFHAARAEMCCARQRTGEAQAQLKLARRALLELETAAGSPAHWHREKLTAMRTRIRRSHPLPRSDSWTNLRAL